MGFPQDTVDVMVGQQVQGVRLLRGTVGTAGAGAAVGPDNIHSTMATAAAPCGVIRTTDPTALATGRLQRTIRLG